MKFEKLWETLPKDFRADFHVYAVIIHHFKLPSEQATNLVRHGPNINIINLLSSLLALQQKGLLHSYLKDAKAGIRHSCNEELWNALQLDSYFHDLHTFAILLLYIDS